VGGDSGSDAGKKVTGRKRHLLVDAGGHRLEVMVLAANVQDRDGAKLLLLNLASPFRDHLLKIWADGGYQGTLITWVHQMLALELEIVKSAPEQKGFQVLPRRWVA